MIRCVLVWHRFVKFSGGLNFASSLYIARFVVNCMCWCRTTVTVSLTFSTLLCDTLVWFTTKFSWCPCLSIKLRSWKAMLQTCSFLITRCFCDSGESCSDSCVFNIWLLILHFREEELEKSLETKTERLAEYKTRVKELETSLEGKDDKLSELQKRLVTGLILSHLTLKQV